MSNRIYTVTFILPGETKATSRTIFANTRKTAADFIKSVYYLDDANIIKVKFERTYRG